MIYVRSCKRTPLRAILTSAFALSIAWCASAAYARTVSILGSPSHIAVVGQAYSFTPTASSSVRGNLVFSIVRKPSWATFDKSTGRLSGTPSAADVGWDYGILIQVSDGVWVAAMPGWSVHVLAGQGGQPPVISGTPAANVTAGNPYSFTPSASDPSGKTLSFSVQNKPTWMNFSIASGTLSGTPTSAQVGTYSNIVVSTSDGTYASSLPAFSVAVNPLTPAAAASVTVDWTPPTKNADGSVLTNLAGFRIYYGTTPSNLSELAQVQGSGTTSYTIGNLAAGTWYFGATAYNSAGIESNMSEIVSTTVQ